MNKYRWYLKDPNIKFSNRLPPQPTIQDTLEEITDRHVTGIWLRKLTEGWITIVAWSNPGADWYHDPEYGILADDGKLIAPLPNDWAHEYVWGFSRYETKRYDLGTDWRAIYGTSGL